MFSALRKNMALGVVQNDRADTPQYTDHIPSASAVTFMSVLDTGHTTDTIITAESDGRLTSTPSITYFETRKP